jgi:DNA primase
MDPLQYLLTERHLSQQEIDYWHLYATSDGNVGIPVLDASSKYLFTFKRLLSHPHQKYWFPENSPMHFCLYGINRALPSIVKSGVVIVVEGAFDVMAMHSVGATNTVSPFTSTVSKFQALQLRRWASKMIIVPDGDEGGRKGLEETQKVFKELGIDIRGCAVTPNYGDPDKILRSGNPVWRNQFIEDLKEAIFRLR